MLQSTDIQLEIDNFSNDFLLIKSRKNHSLAKIGKAIFKQNFYFVEEVIVTETEICLKLNHLFQESNIRLFKTLKIEEKTASNTFKLPIFFSDHEDWKQVSLSTGFSKSEIISKLISTDFSIVIFGFLPGFIYLDGLDKSIHVPRKTIPSKYVKANSIAIGGKYLGLYSLDSPGGWHVVGQMPISILEIPKLPPISFNLGDKIKLHPIDETEYEILLKQPISIKKYNA